MSESHLTLQRIVEFYAGRRPPHEYATAVVQHLRERCPRCAEELDTFNALLREAREPVPLGVAQVVRVLQRAELEEELEREKSRQWPRLRRLLALPAEKRRAAVGKPRGGFREPVLADLLLDEAHARAGSAPEEALALAQLARLLLSHLEPSGLVSALYARATAHAGNALRVLGRLPEAAEAFRDARFWLRATGAGESLVQAEVDHLEGSLFLAERRLDAAARLLERALVAYQMAHEAESATKAYLSLGTIYQLQGRHAKAIATGRKALEACEILQDHRLAAYSRHNLASALHDAGRPAEARECLRPNRSYYRRHREPLNALRHRWLEGKIAKSLGEVGEAESAFLAARDGFLGRGIGYDAALVSLDLAAFYLEQGRTAAVKQLAEEIAPVFAAQDVHREALAALALFQEAALREQLTAAFLGELAAYLEAARENPAAVFQQAG